MFSFLFYSSCDIAAEAGGTASGAEPVEMPWLDDATLRLACKTVMLVSEEAKSYYTEPPEDY